MQDWLIVFQSGEESPAAFRLNRELVTSVDDPASLLREALQAGDDPQPVLVLPASQGLPFSVQLGFSQPEKVLRVLPQLLQDQFVGIDATWRFSWVARKIGGGEASGALVASVSSVTSSSLSFSSSSAGSGAATSASSSSSSAAVGAPGLPHPSSWEIRGLAFPESLFSPPLASNVPWRLIVPDVFFLPEPFARDLTELVFPGMRTLVEWDCQGFPENIVIPGRGLPLETRLRNKTGMEIQNVSWPPVEAVPRDFCAQGTTHPLPCSAAKSGTQGSVAGRPADLRSPPLRGRGLSVDDADSSDIGLWADRVAELLRSGDSRNLSRWSEVQLQELLRFAGMGLAGVCLLLVLWWHVAIWVEGWSLARQNRELRRALGSAFSGVFPGIPAVDPISQARKMAGDLERDAKGVSGLPVIPWQTVLVAIPDRLPSDIILKKLQAGPEGWRIQALGADYAMAEGITAKLGSIPGTSKVRMAEAQPGKGPDGTSHLLFEVHGSWK